MRHNNPTPPDEQPASRIERWLSWLEKLEQPGAFGVKWRRIGFGILLVMLILIAIPILLWLADMLYAFSQQLPPVWRSAVAWVGKGIGVTLILALVSMIYVRHLVIVVEFVKELIARTRDWATRQRVKRDPNYLNKALDSAYREVTGEEE